MTKRLCKKEPNNIKEKGNLIKAPPIKDINKWPAIMLAVSRKVKAKGRIKLLKISTKIIKLTKPRGVPDGTKWAKKFFNDKTHLKKIIPTQKE